MITRRNFIKASSLVAASSLTNAKLAVDGLKSDDWMIRPCPIPDNKLTRKYLDDYSDCVFRTTETLAVGLSAH